MAAGRIFLTSLSALGVAALIPTGLACAVDSDGGDAAALKEIRRCWPAGLLGNPLILSGVIVEIALVVLIGHAARKFYLRNCPDRRQVAAPHSSLRRRDAGSGRSTELMVRARWRA